MKRIAAIVLASTIATSAFASGPTPIIEPVVIVEEASSSSSALLVPVILGIVMIAMLAKAATGAETQASGLA
jgi:hypothetical protein